MKPAILIMTSTFPRWENDTQPRFVLDFAQSISKYYQVYVQAPAYGNAKKSEKYGEVTVYRFRYFFSRYQKLAYGEGMADNLRKNKVLFLLLPFFLFSQLLSSSRIIFRHNIRIVNTHWIYPQGVVGLAIKSLLRNKIFWVVHSHGGDLYRFPSLNRLKRWVVIKSDLTCVVSEAMKEALMNVILNDAADNVIVNSMGVDFTNTFIDRQTIGKKRKDIIFVGRLSPKKGLETIIDALSLLNERGMEISLLVVGGGDRSLYEQHCESRGISSKVTFYGEAVHADVCKLLNQHKYFVFSSRKATTGDEEGLGLAPIEAMGVGCLVIASDIPQVRDYVKPDETGILFPPGDYFRLAAAIERLECSPELAERVISNGKSFSREKYGWESVSERLYREISMRFTKVAAC